MKKQTTYTAEVTDTFGGEANYCWIRRYIIKASSPMGAIRKLAKHEGYSFRKEYDTGDMVRYNAKGACVCAFIEWVDLDGWCDLGGAKYTTI